MLHVVLFSGAVCHSYAFGKIPLRIRKCYVNISQPLLIHKLESFLNYNQQNAKFLEFLFLQTLYTFQTVLQPIIKSTNPYVQLQGLSTNTAAGC